MITSTLRKTKPNNLMKLSQFTENKIAPRTIKK
jgi:hypothetical protein